MQTVGVSGLKNNPSRALRMAHQGVVLVMNRDKPDELMVGIEFSKVWDAKGVRPGIPSLVAVQTKRIPIWKRWCNGSRLALPQETKPLSS